MTSAFGSTEFSTFVKRFIRVVAVDDIRVKVNVAVQSLIELVLSDLSDQDLTPQAVEGWPAVDRGDGLLLRVVGLSADQVSAVMAQYGFRASDAQADVYVWGGTEAEAVAANARAEAELATRVAAPSRETAAPVSAAPVDVWSDVEFYRGLPGSRDMSATGRMAGRDVLFLQAYLQAPERNGLYDLPTQQLVAELKAKKGQPADGNMDVETWKQLLPRFRQMLQRGDMGQKVRLISAAMIAAGYQDASLAVRASFNRDMDWEVRALQEDRGFRVTGKVLSAEWGALLHHPW